MRSEHDIHRPIDEEYWVAHCEGFRVVGPDGRVGTVLEVAKDESETHAEQLIIGTGLLRRRLLLVDPRDVREIEPHRLRMRLRRSPLQRGHFEPARSSSGFPTLAGTTHLWS